MKQQTKKRLAGFLIFMMLFTMLPAPALAADESTVITITNDNVNAESDAYLVSDKTLCLGGGAGMGGTYSFVLGPNQDEGAFTFWGVEIGGYSTVQGGKAVFRNITNTGTISGGTFDPESGDLYVENRDTGAISGGTFNGNQEGSLTVENYGIISGGTFYGEVKNSGTITDGTFEGEVTGRGTIKGGTFNDVVTNTGTISGGTFNKGILNGGGTIADGVNATVAQGGDLAIVKRSLGTGSITVKQNGIDIPSGKAGETYNVAGFDPNTLVGLYLLTGDETVPAGNYTIESDFRKVAGGTSYDFTMPNEAVTIAAVFDDYVPTEVNFFTYIIKGTDAENLENAQYLGDSLYAIPSLYSFTEDTVLPGDAVPGFITHNSERYDFAGFILSEYDEATDTLSYSLSPTLTISAEPAWGTDAWEKWKASVPEGLNAAYMLHEHSFTGATCIASGTCACGATTDSVDSTNHTGGTEVRNASSATATQSGYTGDTYCLGCNTVLSYGETIAATGGSSGSGSSSSGGYVYAEPDIDIYTVRNDDGTTTRVVTSNRTGVVEAVTNNLDNSVSTVKLDGDGNVTSTWRSADDGPVIRYTAEDSGLSYSEARLLARNLPALDITHLLDGTYRSEAQYAGAVSFAADTRLGGETFKAGTVYTATPVFSMDISTAGGTASSGTLTIERPIAQSRVDEGVKYVAVHDTNPYAAGLADALRVLEVNPDNESWQRVYEDNKRLYDSWEEENGSGAEFGEVSQSDEGAFIEASFRVGHLSPFIIYAFVEQSTRIVMQIDNSTVLAGSERIITDMPPVIVNNRTMVPIRVVTELLGGTADWNAETRTVTLNIDGKVLTLTIGNEIPGYGTSALIMNNRTCVPIRYIAEQSGAHVEWVPATQQIVIEK